MSSAYRWYGHPLSSAIVALLIALIAAATFGLLIGGATLIALLGFLTKCSSAYSVDEGPA